MVNLLAGEQRSRGYLAVNPQGKVPAVVVRGVPGLPDAVLCVRASTALATKHTHAEHAQ